MKWDQVGEHFYETGVQKGVLYIPNSSNVYTNGVPWNGLTSVSETPSGAEPTNLYADDTKYLSLYSAEELGGTIEAYTYPDEFMQCDGSKALADGVYAGQQARSAFGLCFRTAIGNDVKGNDLGYKLHLLYGCKASPSERSYQTINDSPEAITFSWEFTTNPVEATGIKPTSLITIDSTKVDDDALAALELILYGQEESGDDPAVPARLPFPDEVASIFS